MREQFVVPSISSREVARAQRSGVRHGEDSLQPLDFRNGLFSVHSVSISNMRVAIVKRSGISKDRDRALRPRPVDSQATEWHKPHTIHRLV